MKTKREVIARLRHDLREHSADSILTNRYIWSAFWHGAAVLLQRAHDDNKLKDQIVFQSFQIDTEEINPYEDTCVPLDCIACRAKVPEPLMAKSGPIYSFFGSADLYTRYAIVNPTEFEIKSKIKGTPQRYAYLDGGYAYLSKCVPCLTFKVLPADSLAGSKCGVMDTPAYIPDHLFEAAVAIAKESIAKSLGKPYDHTANKNEQN